MKIRNRLSLYYSVTSAVCMLIVLTAIYLLYKSNARQDFFNTLHERALVTAKLYLEADEITAVAIQKIKDTSLLALPQEIIRIYDSTNRSVFIKDPDQYWPNSFIGEVRRKSYLEYLDNDRQVVGIYYNDNQGNYVILVSAVDELSKEREHNLLKIMIVLFVFQILLLYLLGWFFAQKALAPIQEVNKQVQNITATDLHLRLDEGDNHDEIGELAGNFNLLLQRLQSAFEMQQTFIANASHELRTPLTTIVGELEVILSQQRTPEEYKEVMHSVLTEAEKLNYIIQGLLELANAENKIALQQNETIRIDELLWELQQQFERLQPKQQLDIQMPGLTSNDKDLEIIANKHLLTLAIGNVIRNAFKFSFNKPVRVILTSGKPGVSITIIDKGIGISEQDTREIFEPFFRSTKAFSFEGHGMGLFIAFKIISLYGGTLKVNSKEGHGSVFNISFTINNPL